MSKGIKISKTHGLNPTISKCFFCGEPKNEIALLGELPNDAEAPKNLILNYEPCEKCKAKMEQGITLIAVSETPTGEGQPPIANGAYPTGPFIVISEEAVKHIFQPEAAENILKHKKACVPYEVIENILNAVEKNADKE